MKPATALQYLAILCVSVLLSFVLRPKRTIFTCTTFFDFTKQDKWSAFCRAMDSILQHHSPQTLQQIDRWVIVNEYSPKPKADWGAKVAAKYPFVDFIQKDASQKGQAASMNRILKEIRSQTYWIHWEETWQCRAPCLDRMLDVIRSTNVTQLQVTQLKDMPNWLDSSAHPRELRQTPSGIQFQLIYPAPGTAAFLGRSPQEQTGEFVGHWPLQSLLPSINRVSHHCFGEFSTDPKLWPFKFEWDQGRRWLSAGGKKAVLPDGPVIRDNTAHKSTQSS